MKIVGAISVCLVVFFLLRAFISWISREKKEARYYMTLFATFAIVTLICALIIPKEPVRPIVEDVSEQIVLQKNRLAKLPSSKMNLRLENREELGLTVMGFRASSNETVKSTDHSEAILPSLTLDKESQIPNLDTFTYFFRKNLGVLGLVDKQEGHVREIMIFYENDVADDSNIKFSSLVSDLILTTNPSATAEDVHGIMKRTGIYDDPFLFIRDDDTATKINFKGVEYRMTGTFTSTLIFSARGSLHSTN